MSDSKSPKMIECPCGNVSFYVDDQTGRLGKTFDEIARATAFSPIFNRRTGVVSWICMDCVNIVRRNPEWHSIKERPPIVPDDQAEVKVLIWLTRGDESGTAVDVFRKDGGFQAFEGKSGGTVSHWAAIPKGPFDPDITCDGMPPEIHAKALFAASKIVMSETEWVWKQDEQEAMARLCHWASCLLPLPQRPMRCQCGSTRINTEMDVGSDIDESGEEHQHMDTCMECGSKRLWAKRFQNFSTPTTWWEKWSAKSKYGCGSYDM